MTSRSDDELPILPDDYQGAWLTPTELRKRNLELAPMGRRICRSHQGAALPLDEAHFYKRTREGKVQFEGECINCYRARNRKIANARYRNDKAFAARAIARNAEWAKANPEKHRATVREHKRNQRRQKFARILGVRP